MKIVRYDIASGRTEPWREIDVTDPAGFMQFNESSSPLTASPTPTRSGALSRLYVVHGLK